MDARVKEMLIKIAPFIILAIIILIIANKFKSLFGLGESKDDKIDAKNQTSEISYLKVDPKKKNFNESTYISWANSLEAAMDGFGTDDKTITKILNSVKNQDDWNYLIKVFGMRKGENLISWLRNEYDSSTMYGLTRGNLNTILMSKGIKENLI